MKFLTVRDLRSKSAQIWKLLPEEREMVVTNNGRPVAILSAVSDARLEQDLAAIRRARAEAAVARIQEGAVSGGRDKTGVDEINAEIAAVRKGRIR
ncbi:MAG: type II toxin-antitoxin system Phd/YefM family antitoxin [Planctomycetota bacterium]